MKIEKVKENFKPATITLEDQEELDMFTKIFTRVGGERFRDAFDGRSTIADMLRSVGGNSDQMHVAGAININYSE